MNKKITILTTFSDKGYDVYAKPCVSSLQRFLSDDVEMIVYTDTPRSFDKPNWINKILESEVPDRQHLRNAIL